jgi:hypothetical protein
VVEAAVSRRPTRIVVVWTLFVLLVGVVVLLEVGQRAGRGWGRSEEPASRALLVEPVERLGAIEVLVAGRLHRFERGAGGLWLYHGSHSGAESGSHQHAADPAQAQRIGAAFDALGRARIEREFSRAAGGPDYGVTSPQVVILLYRPREPQPLAQYAVGDVAPDTASRYVERVGSGRVVTIPTYQIDNLLQMVASTEGAARP